jgi:thymidylate kinase
MGSSLHRSDHTRIVTFSGIDGAGKSTQIESLRDSLEKSGLQTALYTFWDDVAALSCLRERMSRLAFRGDSGVGCPEKPISRRDKNVQSWYAIAARIFFYFVDALSLRRTLAKVSREGPDVALFDRYIYDELANLPLHSPLVRLYVKTILKLIPTPDRAFLIDADPEAARVRKPEYPLEFLRDNRNAYLAVSRLVPTMIRIEPGSIEAAKTKIREAFSSTRPRPVSPQINTLVFDRCPPVEGPR